MKKSLLVILLLFITQINAQICFNAAGNYAAGSNVGKMINADFNGDGFKDLVVANGTSGTANILLGNGTGGFGTNTQISLGGFINSVFSADFNGDGKLDLVTTDFSSNCCIYILLGNGSGGFGSPSTFSTGAGTNPQDVTSADFNGDGFKDVAVTNYSTNNISVFLGNGAGSFGSPTTFATGIKPYSVTSADFNNDGKADLAIANYGSTFTSVMLGNGAGSFGAATNLTIGLNCYQVISADFNGDGNKDLAVGDIGSSSATVFLGNGSGGFGSGTNYSAGSWVLGIVSADFNSDGIPDLAMADNTTWNVAVLQGTGTGSFNAAITYTANTNKPTSITSADFNGDGRPDLAVTNNGSGNVSVLLNTLPTLNVSSNTTICSGNNAILTASGTTNYTWSANAGSATTATVSVSPGSFTTYTVTGNNTSCAVTATRTVSVNVNITPTVTVNASSTIVCAGNTITLSASGTAAAYTWSGGVIDGAVFVPGTTTTYTLTGTGSNGCTNTASQLITVNPLPTVSTTASATLVCAGTPVTITASGTANTYAWSTSATTAAISVSPTVTTTYTVTGTDGNGCINTATRLITTNALPLVTANSTANNFCTGSGGIILTGGGANTYTWTGGVTDGVAFTPSTTQTYTVSGTDGNGCTNTATKTITVSNPPTVFANATTTTLCRGDSVTLFGSGAATYTWTNGVIDGAQFAPNASNTYYVSGTDANGCVNTNSASISIIVNLPPNVTIAVSPGPTTICYGTSITLTQGGTAVSYAWSGGVINGNTFAPTTTTTYSLTGTASNGCTKTTTKTITINPLPNVAINSTATLVCAGTPVTLTASGTATSYSWSTSATTTSISVMPPVTATFTVTGTDINNCKDTATYVVNILANAAPNICMVTVDSTSTNNIIYWDKTASLNADTFFVYRDTANNAYVIIGKVPKDSLSLFVDTARHIGAVNGDPNVGTYRYKLAVKDSCGNLSSLSPYHNTVYTTPLGGGTFSYNQYGIEGQSSPVPGLSQYVLKRDNFNTGSFVSAATIGAGSTVITDPNYSTYQTTANWVVETNWTTVCTPTYRPGSNSVQSAVVKSRSNVRNNRTININQVSKNYSVSIYPNPGNSELTILLSGNCYHCRAEILNVLGQPLKNIPFSNTESKISIADLQNGVYYVKVISNTNEQYLQKLIVQH